MRPELFERCLARLVLDEEAPAQLLALGDHGAAMALGPIEHIFAFRYNPGSEDAFHAHLKKLVRDLRAGRITILVIGGDESTFALCKSVRPLGLKRARVGLLHLDDVGELRTSPPSLRSQAWTKRLDAVGAPVVMKEQDLDDLRKRLRDAVNPKVEGSEQLKAFASALRARRPLATWALAGLCFLVFVLQHLWGGSDFVPALVRMGANGPGLVARGEYERLFASIFLHGNLQHIFFNGMALVVLGSFVERLLGARRFLVLFAFSGLAGSIASAMLGEGFSVGASGAILGLLGASAVFTFRPVPGLLPEVVLVQLKRNMLINMVLVGVVSLLPRVDLFAHMGGVAAGALLVWSGLLTKDLPRLTPANPEDAQDTHRGPVWLSPLAIVSCLAMLGGLGMAMIEGQPWLLAQAPKFVHQNLGETGVQVDVPELLIDRPQHSAEAVFDEFAYGAIDRDPVLVAISVAKPEKPIPADQLEAQFLLVQQAREQQAPKGAKRDGQSRVRVLSGIPTLEEKFVYEPAGLQLWRYSRLYSTAAITIEVLVWPQASTPWRRVGEQMLRSLQAPSAF
ncbi:MAG: rhomboid family intramembrane serine protease [Deltaproteobacteria bacterium]|nr:rhomboid family intramembrane serine protease [Deltaproteobacteria bacterium]